MRPRRHQGAIFRAQGLTLGTVGENDALAVGTRGDGAPFAADRESGTLVDVIVRFNTPPTKTELQELGPYGQMKKLAVDVTQVPVVALNFTLPSATAGFTGRIVTADGGALSFPDGNQKDYPVAAIFVTFAPRRTIGAGRRTFHLKFSK